VGPCHHSIARPRVADGGDGFEIYRVAANEFNKRSRAADKGCHPTCGMGEGLTIPHRRKTARYEMLHMASVLG